MTKFFKTHNEKITEKEKDFLTTYQKLANFTNYQKFTSLRK